MATIGDVAREAGVSRSTVSYALSGKRPISRETHDRIDSAIARLGFTVNAGARALATSQTMVLGLLLQFHEDEFAPAMLQYVLPVSDTARELGYDILMVTDADGPSAVRRITSSEMVDGVVLLDVTHADVRLEALRAARQPGALVGLPGDTEDLDVFDLDFGESARMLVDHLFALGHREIMLISPPKHVFDRGGAYGWRFRDAALERAARYGIRVFPYYGESQQPAINQSLTRILDARPTATAMIVHNDATIAALPALLHDRGVRVPDDLSVVSLYSQDFGRTFSLPYTAIETSPDKLGRYAVQQLVRRIINPEQAGPPVVQFIAPELTDRGSSR
ncbi:LacI family DNA-binding transcriptional regulator [Lacisediminihabitans sp.]|jgi:DNA-binding LacI/PurR family transcriptional regulator|uniref:LacI family DNA-binding transcriptional regulator n=1 Tax=Lacisediminihabitans sp. TaxID=2787631 RepID=UPI002F953DFA